MRLKTWIVALALAAQVTLILLPVSPIYRPAPGDDPSIYLYIADRLLEGKVPYLAGWDQKPPMIFFLFALARAATPHSIWGLWGLEWAGWVIFGLTAYRLLSGIIGKWGGLFAAASAMLLLSEFFWGGSVEDTSLAFQMLIAAGFACIIRQPRSASPWTSLGVGVLIGISFFMKQTLIAAGIASALFLLVRGFSPAQRRSWFSLAYMAVGVVMCALPILLYFWINGAMEEFWRQAFIYNWMYSNLGPLERVNALIDALEFLSGYPGMVVGLAAWLFGTCLALLQAAPLARRWLSTPRTPTVLLAGGTILALVATASELVGSSPGLGLGQAAMLALAALFLGLGAWFISPRRRQVAAQALAEVPALHSLWNSPEAHFKIDLLNFAGVYFPLALLLASTSGRTYVYYFIPLAPPALLLTALTADFFFSQTRTLPTRRMAAAAITALVLVCLLRPALGVIKGYSARPNPPLSDLETYIIQNTRPDDTILAWGHYALYLYITTERQAPTRFFNQPAIHLESFNQRFGITEELLADLQARPPALIITDKLEIKPEVGVSTACKDPTAAQRGTFSYFLCTNYSLVKVFDEQVVYRHNRLR